jgi:hypothetical protein
MSLSLTWTPATVPRLDRLRRAPKALLDKRYRIEPPAAAPAAVTAVATVATAAVVTLEAVNPKGRKKNKMRATAAPITAAIRICLLLVEELCGMY